MIPQILEWTSLTGMVNEMKSPRTFLRDMFFSDVETLSTENILYSVLSGSREAAPFVRKNGKALLFGGYDETEYYISAPNISLAHPLEAADLIFRRHAGDVIFADGSDVTAAAEREVARQLQRMNDGVDNTEEWMCAQAIQGVVEYTSDDEAHFQITYGKPSGNTIVLTDFWNTVDGEPIGDFATAQQVMHDAVELNPTDVVLGSEAAAAFLANDEVRASVALQANLNAGRIDVSAPISANGARFLGVFGGLNVWAYSSSITLNGVSTPLIRAKYAEFLHRSPLSEMKLYYGAIPDLDALDAGKIASRRFSKSYREQNPSAQMLMLMARPLPVTRRPGATVSMKVVSG